MTAILSNRREVGKTRARSGAAVTNTSVVTSRLKHIEAVQGHSDQNDDIDALWRKRAELAKRIVDAAAPTIQELLLKVAMIASLLSEGEVFFSLPVCSTHWLAGLLIVPALPDRFCLCNFLSPALQFRRLCRCKSRFWPLPKKVVISV